MKEFSIDMIRDAASRLAGQIVTTPLLSSPQLDDLAGARILVKAENLQLTGSFKIRGALNKIMSLSSEERSDGVVAFSSGNHGQAVAAAAKQAGCPAVIVLPENAPQIKIDNCHWWGADVVLYDPATQDREVVAKALVEERRLTLIRPFDDPAIMAGQGTAGLELSAQAAERGYTIDAIVVGCSGGGLASGVFTAVKDAYPDARTYIAEPAGWEKMRLSLESGRPERNPPGIKTVMDALSGPNAGAAPLEVLRQYAPTCFGISEEAALQAVATAFRYLKVVVEPGGAAALAAVLQNPDIFRGKTVAVVCSGGNVDAEIFTRALVTTS